MSEQDNRYAGGKPVEDRKQPQIGSVEYAVQQVSAALRSLPSKNARHKAAGLALATLKETDQIKGWLDILEVYTEATNHYHGYRQ